MTLPEADGRGVALSRESGNSHSANLNDEPRSPSNSRCS